MKVLSIDLDYIMGPSIELYNNIHFDHNPSTRWRNLFEKSPISPDNLIMDQSNLMFCFNIFLKSIKKCNNVSFGYEHDSILYYISKYENIDLINIDHHDDVFAADYYGDYEDAYDKEYSEIVESGRIHEGNWIAWLISENKINSYTWVGNKNSGNKTRNDFNYKFVPNYKNIEKEEYKDLDNNFDHIFVCLSPQYVPQKYWHYLSMFITVYEEFTGNSAKIDSWSNKKFEAELRNSKVTNEILHQCSNGR